VILFLIGGIFLKKKRLKKLSLVASLVISIFFSETLIFNFFMDWWEPDAKPIESINEKYDFAVLLGGIATYDSEGKKIIPRYSADRLLQVERLYKKGKIKKIFIAGGAASLFFDDIPESEFLKKHLEDVGIPGKDIIIENKSKNTYENAIFTYKIFKQKGLLDKKFLLVTSAYHMRRAEACFKRAGFSNFDAFPVDHYGGRLVVDYHLILLPKVEIMAYWNILIKEWVGIIMYKLVGYI